MPQLLWDASGLSKRYYSENGTATVNALFSAARPSVMSVTCIGYAEAAAILRRKLNQGDTKFAAFQKHVFCWKRKCCSVSNSDSGQSSMTTY